MKPGAIHVDRAMVLPSNVQYKMLITEYNLLS